MIEELEELTRLATVYARTVTGGLRRLREVEAPLVDDPLDRRDCDGMRRSTLGISIRYRVIPYSERGIDPFAHLQAINIYGVLGGAADRGKAAALRAHLAQFSEEELHELRPLNPATRNSAHGDLSSVRLWIRDHMLVERINLFDALESVGLRPGETTIFAKADRSRYRDRVIATLAERGYKIMPEEEIDLTIASTKVHPTHVVDDGGELILRVARSRAAGGRQPFYLETTSKGSRLLKEENPELAYADISSGAVKKSLSRAIAASFIRQLLHFSAHVRIDGTKALLFGYGKIGELLAKQLQTIGVRVTIVDPSEARRCEAGAAGFESVASASDLEDTPAFHWVVGCSGLPSVNAECLSRLAPMATFCSVSSQDLRSIFKQSMGTLEEAPFGYWLCNDVGRFRVLGDGHALNLFKSEGVPEPDFDVFQAEIVKALCSSVSMVSEYRKVSDQ